MNYFELFGLTIGPVVDKTDLSKKYFELQRKFHPDFFSHLADEERENALQQSADINKAYVILKEDLLTLEYYLQLKGLIAEGEKYNLPNSFLMEMMEINELLDEGKSADQIPQINEFKEALNNEIKSIFTGKELDLTEQDLQNLKSCFYRKKYLLRILDRMND